MVKTPKQIELYREYEKYCDKTIGDELMKAIETRYIIYTNILHRYTQTLNILFNNFKRFI